MGERGSAFWRKDKAERGLGFSNIYLHLLGFRIDFFLRFFKKKKIYCVDVENCGSFKGFGFIYIYILISCF